MNRPDIEGRSHVEAYRQLRRRYAPFRLAGFVAIIVGFVGLVLTDVEGGGRVGVTVWFVVALAGLLVAMAAQSQLRCPMCGRQPFGRNVWNPEFCSNCGTDLQ
jgi:hypothetical protein